MGPEDIGPTMGGHPVAQHALAVARHERNRQLLVRIFARDDPVLALGGKKSRPLLQPVLINTVDIGVQQVFDGKTAFQTEHGGLRVRDAQAANPITPR